MSDFRTEAISRFTNPHLLAALESAGELDAANTESDNQIAIGPCLPSCELSKIPVPNAFLRSALFTATAQSCKRKKLTNHIIATPDGITLKYTGDELGQDDKRLLHVLIDLARPNPLGTIVQTTSYSLLKKLNRSDNTFNYLWLHRSLDRLIVNKLEIKVNRFFFKGSIISSIFGDSYADTLNIFFDPGFITLYGNNDWTAIDNAVVSSLARSPLAQWLYGYAISHVGTTIGRHKLQKLSGSEDLRSKTFNQALQRAAKLLVLHTNVRLEFVRELVNISHELTPSQNRHLLKKLCGSKSGSKK